MLKLIRKIHMGYEDLKKCNFDNGVNICDGLPIIYSTHLHLSLENLHKVHDNNIFRFTIEDMFELSPFSCLCFGVIEKISNNNEGQRFFENYRVRCKPYQKENVMITLNTNDYVYFNNGTVLHHIDFITVDNSLHDPEYRCYKNLSKKFWWNKVPIENRIKLPRKIQG